MLLLMVLLTKHIVRLSLHVIICLRLLVDLLLIILAQPDVGRRRGVHCGSVERLVIHS